MNNFSKFFHSESFLGRFFSEKNLDSRTMEITDQDGNLHLVDTGVVIETISRTSGTEREQIENIIRKIDFMNGDLHHFFRHLGEGLVHSRSGRRFGMLP